MAVVLTYDGVLSRVRIQATGIGASADVARVERSTNQVTWTTVRGAGAVPVAAGVLSQTVDDYEFVDGVINYYRVTAIDTSPITFRAAGAAATGNNATVNPALPAGLTAGDLLLVLASIRNSGTGTPNTPAGYTLLAGTANQRLFGKIAGAGEGVPAVTFAGGAANADTIAQTAAWRNAGLTPAIAPAVQLNGSAQNIDRPALTVAEDGQLLIRTAWKQDDWTTITAGDMTAVTANGTSTTTGDDAAQWWGYLIQTTATSLVSGTHTVAGGGAAISRTAVLGFAPAAFLSQETDDITPALTQVWLKSIARPFLNRPVTVTDWSDVERPSRAGIYPVKGRSLPVAVSDVRGSRSWTLEVRAGTASEARNLDVVLASGDPLYVHVPADGEVPGGYVCVGDTSEGRPRPRTSRRIFQLPMTEIAPPGPDVVGATVTWQTVLSTYATWADVLAAHPTWADLLELIGDPGDVIVP
jgi:hypothetical protein